MIMTKFIMEYDIELGNEKVPMAFAWGVLRIPHPRLAFVLRKRTEMVKPDQDKWSLN